MRATLRKEKGGGAMQMAGMHRVAEKNLENLNAAQLKNLMRKGYLARVYLHLISLENFGRLLDLKGERCRVQLSQDRAVSPARLPHGGNFAIAA